MKHRTHSAKFTKLVQDQQNENANVGSLSTCVLHNRCFVLSLSQTIYNMLVICSASLGWQLLSKIWHVLNNVASLINFVSATTMCDSDLLNIQMTNVALK